MKYFLFFFIILITACSKQQVSINTDNNIGFDFSQLYHVHGNDEYLYDAHRNVPLGEIVAINDLDSIFGNPILCDTVTQTTDNWSLYEQENQAADFLPSEIGDTLYMMRRIYGKEGDWLIWIDLEIQNSDSSRVLNFIAYDNSHVEI